MKIKNYSYKGKEEGNTEVDFMFKEGDFNNTLFFQYLRVFQSNQRHGTSKVKTKSEVSGGGRKPWRQKGTGRARSGSIRSPIWVGGGVAHGPEPKDWTLKLTKNMRSRVFRDVFAMKFSDDCVISFDYPQKGTSISSKDANGFLDAIGFSNTKVLVIHEGIDSLYRSFRNLKNVVIKPVNELNSFDIANSEKVVIEKNSVIQIQERLKK